MRPSVLFSPHLQGWPPPGHLMPTANMGYPGHLPHHVRILHSAHYHGLSPLADSASRTCLSLVAESIAPDLAVHSTAYPMARLPIDIDCMRNDSNNENNICFCYFYLLPTQCQAWHISSHLILMHLLVFPILPMRIPRLRERVTCPWPHSLVVTELEWVLNICGFKLNQFSHSHSPCPLQHILIKRTFKNNSMFPGLYLQKQVGIPCQVSFKNSSEFLVEITCILEQVLSAATWPCHC